MILISNYKMQRKGTAILSIMMIKCNFACDDSLCHTASEMMKMKKEEDKEDACDLDVK